MEIETVVVGESILDVPESATLDDSWRVLELQLAERTAAVAIVMTHSGGEQHFGRIFDAGQFHAFWETTAELRADGVPV
jgi:hypothetical protein